MELLQVEVERIVERQRQVALTVKRACAPCVDKCISISSSTWLFWFNKKKYNILLSVPVLSVGKNDRRC